MVAMCFMVGYIHSVAYLAELNISYLIYVTGLILFYFLCLSWLSMVIVYIEDLHMNLTSMNTDNIKLLNGMHEGLLILNKNEDFKRIMFCNTPVIKLITANMAVLK